MTFCDLPAYYCIVLPNGKIIVCQDGKELDAQMNDERLARYQPQQIKIQVRYK